MPTVLRRLKLEEISLVDAPANPHARVLLAKAQWDAAYINDLPDSAFAVIEGGGQKDSSGKTTPRSLRHLPYKDKDGKVDLPHLRNALSRLPQTQISSELKDQARARLEAAAREAGIGNKTQKKEKTPVSEAKKDEANAEIATLRKMLDDIEKNSDSVGGDGELTPEAKTLRKMVTQLIEAKKTAIFTKKAEALKGLPGTTVAKLVPIIQEIAEKAPEAWSKLEPLLKNWHAAFETSELFSERGATGAEGATAEERATALAQERINKGQAKSLGDALSQVFKADPALYREYRKETQFKVGAGARA